SNCLNDSVGKLIMFVAGTSLPLFVKSKRSEYFFGFSFEAIHLRVSTRRRERFIHSRFSIGPLSVWIVSLLDSSAISSISSAKKSACCSLACAYCCEKSLFVASQSSNVLNGTLNSNDMVLSDLELFAIVWHISLPSCSLYVVVLPTAIS